MPVPSADFLGWARRTRTRARCGVCETQIVTTTGNRCWPSGQVCNRASFAAFSASSSFRAAVFTCCLAWTVGRRRAERASGDRPLRQQELRPPPRDPLAYGEPGRSRAGEPVWGAACERKADSSKGPANSGGQGGGDTPCCAGSEVQGVACGRQPGGEPAHLEAHLTLVTGVRKILFNFLSPPYTLLASRVVVHPGHESQIRPTERRWIGRSD
jgi:hypothetical protein